MIRLCYKRGHKSKGAAEAHIRALLKIGDSKPDVKNGILHAYICTRPECRRWPWHVGHGSKLYAGGKSGGL